MTAVGIMDYFSPSCEENGDFSPKQCGMVGCWCVYRDGTFIGEGTHAWGQWNIDCDRGTKR